MGNSISLGTYHIQANPNLYNPQQPNHFEFVVTDLGDLLRAGVPSATATSGDYINNGQEVLRLSINATSVPHFTQGEIEISRGNSKVYFPGTATFDTVPLEVIDYIGARSKDIALAWQRLSYDVTSDSVDSGVNCKKNGTLIEYTPDGEPVRYWDMLGCWIRGISGDDYNMESNGKKTFSATIRYDRAISHYPN